MAPPSLNLDTPALNENGQYKDAEDMEWLNSPSDEQPPKVPDAVAAAPPVQQSDTGQSEDPVRPKRVRRQPIPRDVPLLVTKVAGTRDARPAKNALRRKRAESADSTSSAGKNPKPSTSRKKAKMTNSPADSSDDEPAQHRPRPMPAEETNDSDNDLGLDDDLEQTTTDGVTDLDADDNADDADGDGDGEKDEDALLVDTDEERYHATKAKENAARQSKPGTREKRAKDLLTIFKVSSLDKKDGRGEKTGCWCTLCIQENGGKKRHDFFHTGSNSSLRSHIARVPGHYEVYVEECEKIGVEPHDRAKPKPKKGESGIQSTLDSFATTVTPTPHWTKEGLLDHIIELIVESDSAFRLVERGAFRRLLIYQRPKTSDSDIPRRTLIRDAILAKLEKLDGIDKANIKAVKSLISMTFDGWTSRPGNPFLSLTIHYIDAPASRPRDWVLKSQLLALDKINGSHSGANIAEIITAIIKKYGFTGKAGWWTADNVTTNDTAVAEICRALDPEGKLLVAKERRGHCIEHAIHLAAHHFVKGLNGASDAKIRARLHGHPTASMDEDDSVFDEMSDDEEVDTSMDVEGDADDEEGEDEWTAGDVVGKVLAFVRQVRLSPQAREFLKKTCRDADDAELELLTWIRTRWASLHNCFDRVITLQAGIERFFARADRADVLPTLKKKKYSDFEFTEDDWKKINLIHSVLKEPAAAQQELSSEKVPTVARALPILETLQTRWEEMLADPEYEPVYSGLEHGPANLRKWYKKTDDSDIYFLCLVLDPTVKLEYFKAEWDEAWIKKHMDRFEKTYERYAAKVQIPKESSTTHETSSAQRTGHYGSAALDRARRERQQREREQTHTQSEIRRYLDAPLEVPNENGAPFDVVRWWGHHQSEYPVLALIARDYLAIQGSSVASERAFSAAGNTVTLKRNGLSARMVEALQRLKGAYRDGRLSAVDEAWLHLDETFDEAAYETEDD